MFRRLARIHFLYTVCRCLFTLFMPFTWSIATTVPLNALSLYRRRLVPKKQEPCSLCLFLLVAASLINSCMTRIESIILNIVYSLALISSYAWTICSALQMIFLLQPYLFRYRMTCLSFSRRLVWTQFNEC